MANKILLRRGLKSKLPTLSAGEPAYTTDSREFFMGTGSGNVNMGGSQWYTGTAMSGTSTSSTYSYTSCPLVKVGDIYLNTSYGYIYQCTTAGSGSSAKWNYKGTIREDDFFNILHEDGFTIAGIVVDINPITEDKTGLLAEYLESAEQFLKEKVTERKQEKPSVRKKIKQAKQISQDRKTGNIEKSKNAER